MPDNYATMTDAEQKFFDTQGAVTPDPEQVEETTKAEPEIKQEKKPVLTTKKASREAKKVTATVDEAPAEEVETTAETVAPVKDARDEQIENLNKALREERMATKERDRLTNERIKLIQEAILQSRQQPAQQQQHEVIPDVEKDPLGTLKYLLEQQKKGTQVQHLSEQQVQQQHQAQRVMNDAGRMENEWLQQQEDYDASINPQTGMPKGSAVYNEASSFLVNMRRAELLATGAYTPMQAQQVIAQEAIQLAHTAIQNGRNPAQVIMDIARARQFKPTPKQVAAVEKIAPAETEQEKITRIGKAQEAGFSLSQAAGGKAPNNSKLDAKALANMPDAEFAAFVENAKKSDLRALFGD